MERRIINIVTIVVIILGVGYLTYTNFFMEDDVMTAGEKLDAASFVLKDSYYVRDVEQEDGNYEEVFAIESDEFMRIMTGVYDEEIYSYNYADDTFSYLYYFEEELIMRLDYDYALGEVTLDEDEQYSNLETDITNLKAYFEKLLTDNELEVSEL